MRTFFLRRALREKVLMLAFAALALFIWANSVLGRGRAVLDSLHAARSDLQAQQVWLQNGPGIDARAAAATKSLEPAKTLNATKLVGELNTMATEAGLNADISSQQTESTTQFAFHTVQVGFRRASMISLLNFYEALSKRAPYIGLDQCMVAVDLANPEQYNASFRVVSAELNP